MGTATVSLGKRNLAMSTVAEQIRHYWLQRLELECPEQKTITKESIVRWLLDRDLNRLEMLTSQELDIAHQAMEYRWNILHKRYLGVNRERAYGNLMKRLGSLMSLRGKVQTSVALSGDRQRSVIDVLQEVIQDLLQSDTYMQRQMAFIAELTKETRLQDTLLLASIEEYALRPVRNQPLLVYRFVNYLHRNKRHGFTYLPSDQTIKLVGEEMISDNTDHHINLLDSQVIAEYQEAQHLEEQQLLRKSVQTRFSDYLQEKLGQEAVNWLELYLAGKSQDEIAKQMQKSIQDIYRLREKISYHAVRIFALKEDPELIESWLSTSLKEHNLGLTSSQWQQLYEQLTPQGKQVLNLRKAGNSMELIAKQLNLKTHQAMGEWTKIFLAAQDLRNQQTR